MKVSEGEKLVTVARAEHDEEEGNVPAESE